MQPTPDPSHVFEKWKYIVQMLEVLELCPILILFTSIVQESFSPVGFRGRNSNNVFGGMGEGCAR